MKHKATYQFKKGQKLHLDEIHAVQAALSGENVSGIERWWEPDDGDLGDDITVTKNIKFMITIEATE